MKSRKCSKKTLALIAIAVLLFASGGLMQTQARLSIFSEDYRAEFELDHLRIHLLENGEDVCGGNNTLQNKQSYLLLQARGYDGNKPGTFEPGRVYKEEIAAENGSDVPEYVRLTIRKYWMKADPETGKLVKDTTLKPSLIHLAYGGKDYNNGAWTINPVERTTEASTYYLNTVLAKNKPSANLFDTFWIDESLVDSKNIITSESEPTSDTDEGMTTTTKTITYTYKYDGYIACIEADVQSIQTHNVNDAIESLWGVPNVSASGGKVTVK